MIPFLEHGNEIILASSLPRRKEIFSLLGISFRVVAPRYKEVFDDRWLAKEEVALFAEEKARSLESDFPNSIIIGSDTLVECDEEKIGKPKNRAESQKILQRMQGKEHSIYSAVAIIGTVDRLATVAVEQIKVVFREISIAESETYVLSGEGLDKAGGYSIQGKGREFVKKFEGDYLAAVGLPLRPIADFLQRHHIKVPVNIEQIYQEHGFKI
jgi:septum formation protein